MYVLLDFSFLIYSTFLSTLWKIKRDELKVIEREIKENNFIKTKIAKLIILDGLALEAFSKSVRYCQCPQCKKDENVNSASDYCNCGNHHNTKKEIDLEVDLNLEIKD